MEAFVFIATVSQCLFTIKHTDLWVGTPPPTPPPPPIFMYSLHRGNLARIQTAAADKNPPIHLTRFLPVASTPPPPSTSPSPINPLPSPHYPSYYIPLTNDQPPPPLPATFPTLFLPPQSTNRGRGEIGGVYICPLSWSRHHNFARDGR